jgi:hypothetical protein
MKSKNKPAPRVDEKAHIERIASMNCAICWAEGPSEVHEPEQGLWFLSIPLCADCHRGSFNGLHGQKRAWSVRKMTELVALNETLRKVFA